MDDIYKAIEEHDPNKNLKILIVFDDMNADMLNPIVTGLFKLNISLFLLHNLNLLCQMILD